MNRSRRGAAKISVVWMITVVVMFLVAFAMAVVAFQDQSAALSARTLAEANEARERELAEKESGAHSELTRLVGWFDAEVGIPRTDRPALQAALAETKTTFGLGDDVRTIADLLPEVRKAVLAKDREIGTLKQQIAEIESEKSALQQTMRDSIRAKDDELTSVRSQLADANQAAADKQSELEARVAGLRDQTNQLDISTRQAATEFDQKAREFAEQVQGFQVRLDAQGRKLNPFVKEPEQPDGRVLSVSSSRAWIDIGSHNRLATGTRFRVVDADDPSRAKAWATVTQVDATMAEVAISEVADRFDPVAKGDVVYNPLFDPRGERYAVLAGRFSGSLNENELSALLASMNIQVQQALDPNTDFLIVGAELYVDPVTLEPLEEPLSPSELPVYKDAQAQGGIAIIPLKDLRSYFVL